MSVLMAVLATVLAAAVLSGASVAWGAIRHEGPSTPAGRNCPADRPVKGNLTNDGERIYHEPGWAYYDATTPESCFGSASDARAAGFRASKVQ